MQFKTRLIARTMGLVAWALLLHSPPTVMGQFRDVTPQQPDEQFNSARVIEDVDDDAAPDPQPIHEMNKLPERPAAKGNLFPNAEADIGQNDASEAQRATAIRRLEEMIDAELIDDTDFRPLRFRGILVGEASRDQLLEKWGEPFKTVNGEDFTILKYRALPFRQVDVTIVGNQVASILIHLFDLQDPAHIAKELRMTKIEPVPIPDEFGNVMGLAYPERGVLLGFDLLDPESLVSKIQLEPISPEPILLRAEYNFDHAYAKQFADIDKALQLNPRYSRALALRARLLGELGRSKEALTAIEAAMDLEDVPDDQLLRARLYESLGRTSAARRELEKLSACEDLPRHIAAEIELLKGDLLCKEAPGKFNQALRHHLKAIEIAATLANSAEFVPRRAAKRTLVDAHLAVARDISMGNFQKQQTVVPKWLQRAEALVKEYVRRDQGDPAMRLRVAQQALACAADLRSPDDPAGLIDDVIDFGRKQIAISDDESNKHRLEWMLGLTLAEATRLQRIRGQFDEAIDTANGTLALFQQSAPQRQSTPDQKYLVGRLYFHIGSLHAVQRKDHREAIGWYIKAEPMLSVAAPSPLIADTRTHGESYISMGVSYWETGDQEKAIELTEIGTDILQKAVVSGWLTSDVLAIPYSNLAAMHSAAGHDTEAKAFADLSASLETESSLQ